MKEYRDNNKEKNRIKCECGCEVTKSNLKRHKSNKKHIDLKSVFKNKIF